MEVDRLSLLNQILSQVPFDLQPTPTDFKIRKKVVKELQEYLRKTFPNATVRTFGSTVSGSCFHNSDIDISLAIRDGKYAKASDRDILEDVIPILARSPDLTDVDPKMSAKVPVVKFKHISSNIPLDLSMHNSRGLQTSSLENAYSRIDDRYKTMIYALKVMVKLCGHDGYRGHFTVSTYILLVMYFLQQRKPPVLPVLHELYQGTKPDLEDGEMDIYYFDNISQLHLHWPEFGKNKESVGELWLAFLKFYAEEFDPHAYIVSTRQLEVIDNPNAGNTSRHIAVENPVEVGLVNPGIGLSFYDDMITLFKNAHHIFSDLRKKPKSYDSYKDYAFDPSLLTVPQS